MLEMLRKIFLVAGAIWAVTATQAGAQWANDIAALRGLAPVAVLTNTTEGNAALGAN